MDPNSLYFGSQILTFRIPAALVGEYAKTGLRAVLKNGDQPAARVSVIKPLKTSVGPTPPPAPVIKQVQRCGSADCIVLSGDLFTEFARIDIRRATGGTKLEAALVPDYFDARSKSIFIRIPQRRRGEFAASGLLLYVVRVENSTWTQNPALVKP